MLANSRPTTADNLADIPHAVTSDDHDGHDGGASMRALSGMGSAAAIDPAPLVAYAEKGLVECLPEPQATMATASSGRA